jgi:hypothetical protein
MKPEIKAQRAAAAFTDPNTVQADRNGRAAGDGQN